MALTDIVFAEGEPQLFILSIPIGTLNSPDDIVYDEASCQDILEATTSPTEQRNIFIMID